MPASNQPRAPRIVVVEDNYDANAGLVRLLKASGFDVAGRAYDGAAGLNIIRETKPDVVILDIAMPVLDGLSLARLIRSEIGTPPHLVALTGFGREEDKAEAEKAGFDAFFRKPADWPRLEAVLRSFGGGARSN